MSSHLHRGKGQGRKEEGRGRRGRVGGKKCFRERGEDNSRMLESMTDAGLDPLTLKHWKHPMVASRGQGSSRRRGSMAHSGILLTLQVGEGEGAERGHPSLFY